MTWKCNSLSFPVERLKEYYDYDYESGYLISRKGPNTGKPVNGHLSTDKGKWHIALYRKDGSKLQTNYGRAVFAWCHSRWPEGSIDHIDRNIRNNRIENLREADRTLQAQNTWNYNYGATWNKEVKKWKSKIFISGKTKDLGYYHTQKEAQEAFMRACDEIGRKYLPPYLFNDRYVPEERVMGIR
jgi:hypothetical protein